MTLVTCPLPPPSSPGRQPRCAASPYALASSFPYSRASQIENAEGNMRSTVLTVRQTAASFPRGNLRSPTFHDSRKLSYLRRYVGHVVARGKKGTIKIIIERATVRYRSLRILPYRILFYYLYYLFCLRTPISYYLGFFQVYIGTCHPMHLKRPICRKPWKRVIQA